MQTLKIRYTTSDDNILKRIKTYDEFIGSIGLTEESSKHNGKEVAGFKEVIEVVGLGKMKAKLDTGNTTKYNAIIVQDYYEKDGKVKFGFNGKEYEYPVEKHVRIWHHGKSTERPIIKVDLVFNDRKYKDELVDLKISDLTGTKNYRSRMLICKKFMEEANIIIDPSKDFNLTDETEIKRPMKKKRRINESKETVEMELNDNGDVAEVSFTIDGEQIGGAILTEQYIDGVISEYTESVDDFDENVFKGFDHNRKMYSLEDFWIEKEYRGQGYSRPCLELLMKEFDDRQMVLRAFPDGGVDEKTLVRICSDYGFKVLQETEYDGTIMGKFVK